MKSAKRKSYWFIYKINEVSDVTVIKSFIRGGTTVHEAIMEFAFWLYSCKYHKQKFRLMGVLEQQQFDYFSLENKSNLQNINENIFSNCEESNYFICSIFEQLAKFEANQKL